MLKGYQRGVVDEECSKSEFGGPEKGLGGEGVSLTWGQAVDLGGLAQGPPKPVRMTS